MFRSNRKRTRGNKGQCFIELIAGSMILVPVCLLGLNLITLVLANSMNDSLAKSAARAAANQQTQVAAQAAAEKVVDAFPESVIIKEMKLSGPVDFQGKDQVKVKIAMKVHVPTPFPGMSDFNFQALAVEAVVGNQADI